MGCNYHCTLFRNVHNNIVINTFFIIQIKKIPVFNSPVKYTKQLSRVVTNSSVHLVAVWSKCFCKETIDVKNVIVVVRC